MKESREKDRAGAWCARITQLALLARSGCKNVPLQEEKEKINEMVLWCQRGSSDAASGVREHEKPKRELKMKFINTKPDRDCIGRH